MTIERRSRSAIAAAMIVAGLGLSGCFDVVQSVGVDRTGAGRYQVTATGERLYGPW